MMNHIIVAFNINTHDWSVYFKVWQDAMKINGTL